MLIGCGVEPHGFEVGAAFSEDWRERFAWIAGNRSENVMMAEGAVLGKFHGSVSHIVDIENLCAGDVAGQASDIWASYSQLVGVSPQDQITVAANRSNAVPAFFALPHTARRILVPNEPDAADEALVASVDVGRLARHHSTVVIASGDGYFTGLAMKLRAGGLKVVQVATRGVGVSAGLYVKCDEFISLPDVSAKNIAARPVDRSHLRVRSASARRSSLAAMTARSHGAVPPRTPTPSDLVSA